MSRTDVINDLRVKVRAFEARVERTAEALEETRKVLATREEAAVDARQDLDHWRNVLALALEHLGLTLEEVPVDDGPPF